MVITIHELLQNWIDFSQSIWKICIFALLNVTSHALIVLSRDGRAKKYTNKSSRDNNGRDASLHIFHRNSST